MKTTMDYLRRADAWMKAHKLLTCGFVALILGIGVVLLLAEDDSMFVPILSVYYVVLVVCFARAIHKHPRIISLLLILALVWPHSARAQTEQGGSGGAALCVRVVVGLIVLAGGGTVYVKLRKFCQKKFGKDTNAPPAELNFDLGGTGGADSFAADLSIGEAGSCPPECVGGEGGSGGPDLTTTFTFGLHVWGDLEITPLNMKVHTGPASYQTWPEFVAEARQRHGITVSGHTGNFSFARNGQPIPATESPIKWDATRGVVKVERGSPTYFTIVVESSPDLRVWTPLLKAEVEVGTTVQVEDTEPASQRFYRYWGFVSD